MKLIFFLFLFLLLVNAGGCLHACKELLPVLYFYLLYLYFFILYYIILYHIILYLIILCFILFYFVLIYFQCGHRCPLPCHPSDHSGM